MWCLRYTLKYSRGKKKWEWDRWNKNSKMLIIVETGWWVITILWFIRNTVGHSGDQIHISHLYLVFFPWFLVHSSLNPWNFLSNKSNESIFSYNIWSLVLCSWKYFRDKKSEMGVLLFITKPLSTTTRFRLMKAPKNGSWFPRGINQE